MSQPRAGRRVAVTGIGALSPGGAGMAAYRGWLPGRAGERIAGFDAAAYIRSPKLLRSMHRTFQLMAAVATEALRAAGLGGPESLAAAGIAAERAGIAAALADLSPLTPDLLQVVVEVGRAEEREPIAWAQFAEVGLHTLHPFRRLTLLANMAAAHTSLLFGLQGPSFTFTSGASAGGQTVVEGYWTIAHDRADLMLCHSAGSPEQSFTARPEAEVGGAVVLEEWEQARRRGAGIVAELVAGDAGTPVWTGMAGGPVASLMGALLALAEAGGGTQRVPLAALAGPAVEARA